ncbi:MAG: glutamine-hydrolyzing GMP synthase [Pantoea sp. Brub]|nr:glutamine-hydrolyzing GMP synthase [Pantoea sp. Brub]
MIAHNLYKNSILILDFGSQYTQLIARCIRKIGIYCEIWKYSVTEKQIRSFNPNGIILSGGPQSANNLNSPRIINYIFNAHIPIMGICYGMQAMVVQLGGVVSSAKKREFGFTQIEIIKSNILMHNIKVDTNKNGNFVDVWMSHEDEVVQLPDGFITVASTKNCRHAVIVNSEKQFYCVQFHPEVTQTKQGITILKNFIVSICKCKIMWKPINIIPDIIKNIRKKVGKDKVILGLSGGVDSYVTAILLHRAIGKQLICIFIDNGLLRLNESNEIIDLFDKNLNIVHIQAEKRFLNALIGIKDPEEKRKIIGHLFIDIFNEVATNELYNIKWLAQGTIYPDIIESTISMSQNKPIKTHHNVGGLPNDMNLCLIEPLKFLFKDEVKKIGSKLNIPYKILHRHPFPGPGLAVRILGEVKKEYCDLLRLADAIFIEELHKNNFYTHLSQAFTVFLPIRSVNIMGDNRKYDWVISLRAVKTIDFMTANWANIPYKLLHCIADRIINEVHGVSRVVYDITSKPPATIEWE